MPKIKKNEDDQNSCLDGIIVSKKCKRSTFKFDAREVLKERSANIENLKKHVKLDEEMKIVDELIKKDLNERFIDANPVKPPKLGYIIFDYKDITLKTKNSTPLTQISNSQRFLIMSIEKNDLVANTHLNLLMRENWTPTIDEIQEIFCNWGADLDILTRKKPLLKREVDDQNRINQHCFEFVIKFLTRCVLINGFSENDLLTLAKYSCIMAFDFFCGQMVHIIKMLFNACIQKVFDETDTTAIVTFAQELYSDHKENHLLKIIVKLFLPLQCNSMKTIYTYITYKLYKSLLEKNNNINAFPTSINDWFVQDLVDREYFNHKPKKTLSYVIRLLEHVTIVFDLYQDEKNLSKMYYFLNSCVKKSKLCSESLELQNILDQWRLKLFRLHLNRNIILI